MNHFRSAAGAESYPSATTAEACERLDELIRQVAEDSTRIVLTRDGQPAAVLVSLEDLAFMDAVEDAIDRRLYREGLVRQSHIQFRPPACSPFCTSGWADGHFAAGKV